MTKKILLIEDDFYISDLYKIMLSSAGYEVFLAVDGEEGLELAKKNPDLILLDIMLPKMNGIILLQKLKQLDGIKNIPVVLLTNLGQESVIKSAFDSGASGYLLKARTEPADLLNQVKKFLEKPDYKMDPDKIAFD